MVYIERNSGIDMVNISRTIEANGYRFDVYENGTVVAQGEIKDQPAEKRNIKMQREAGGTSRLGTDQGGHLVAARQYGPSIKENLSAQDRHLNQGPYKTVENAEINVIRNVSNPGIIQTERTAYITNITKNGGRPDAYMINDFITYANNQTQQIHLSFSNLTVQEQEEMEQITDEQDFKSYDNPNDILRENMNTEEYTGLMEETDSLLPDIKDEFNMAAENDYAGLDLDNNSYCDNSVSDAGGSSYDAGDSNGCSIGDN